MDETGGKETEKPRGKIYWLCRNIFSAVVNLVRIRAGYAVIAAVVLLLTIFFLRAPIHSFVMAVRTRVFLVILGAPLIYLLWRLIFHGGWKRRIVTAAISIPLMIVLGQWGDDGHEYLSFYYRYITVKKQELTSLPLTDNERIHPLNSIHSLAFEAMNETETPSIPNFVRINQRYYWTLAIEPAYPIPKTLSGVREVLSLPATTSSPDFSRKRRIQVNLPLGENLLFSRNAATATIKSFSFWRYFNYQPSGAGPSHSADPLERSIFSQAGVWRSTAD